MAAKSREYWKERFLQLEQVDYELSSQTISELERHYRRAQRDIDSQIESWYQRFAQNNAISMNDARKLLNSKELEEFKWDVKEYIKYGQENAIDSRWMKELENASARYHVSRLDSLKFQTQQSLEALYGQQHDIIDAHIQGVFSNDYYHTIFELQKGFNLGWDIASIDGRKLERVINKPWAVDGKNFSSRIWDNKEKLINEVHNELTQLALLGQAPDGAIKNIASAMNSSRVNAGRLVMTETAYFSAVAQEEAFKELGVEKYEIIATLDSRTSEICRSLDGKVFDMKDYEAGVTAPPFHVWCRTTTAPFFDDEFNIGERAAKGEDGKTYYVPSDVTYSDWAEAGLEDGNRLNDFKGLYDEWCKSGKGIKYLATGLTDHEGLPLSVHRRAINAHGQCEIILNNGRLDVQTLVLDSKDMRGEHYQVKTLFHELFHANGHGLEHDMGAMTPTEFIYYEDVFAETTAHYLAKMVGINAEITPGYPEYLIDTLPRLKKLPEYSGCNTIADFGEISYKYRFSKNKTAKWKTMRDELNLIDHDIIDYSKQYLDYIANNKEDLVGQLLENMPQYTLYKDGMVNDLTRAIENVNGGAKFSNNEKMIFSNTLAIAMNRLGVK